MESYYIPRELSWLKFNERVLNQAVSDDVPYYERLKFLSIFTSNLDEFFMIRVGSLTDQCLLKDMPIDNKTKMSAKKQLADVYKAVAPMYQLKDKIFEQLRAELKNKGICHVSISELNAKDKRFLSNYFKKEMTPFLSPQIIDSKHPFPHLVNKNIYVVVVLRLDNKQSFGIIPLSCNIDRIIMLPGENGRFVLAEDVLYHYVKNLFKIYKIQTRCIIRVTRNSDIEVEDGILDEDIDYKSYMKAIIKKRDKLSPVRLELMKNGEKVKKYLQNKLNMEPSAVYISKSPLDMSYVWRLDSRLAISADMKYPSVEPVQKAELENTSVLEYVSKNDLLLSYPYESMKPFLDMLKEASTDKDVVSIKITLYRMSDSSKVVRYLCNASENGKEVTALVELKARFDEENNLNWAKRLEDAGCKVIYGIDGYKVHSKITLITKRTNDGVKYFAHIGTGNYNEKTAVIYTDVGILTSRREICEDAVEFFNNLTISNTKGQYKHLAVAPTYFKPVMIDCINRQIELAQNGEAAIIKLKMNSITDKDLIDALVRASMSGVKIQMIVRGICCLKPGIEGVTDNISVVSIVGRFLEHSRIFIFGTGKKQKVYISSADWMTRNTERRIEIAMPIYDDAIKNNLVKMFDLSFSDNAKGKILLSDGSYVPNISQSSLINSQEEQIKLAIKG